MGITVKLFQLFCMLKKLHNKTLGKNTCRTQWLNTCFLYDDLAGIMVLAK